MASIDDSGFRNAINTFRDGSGLLPQELEVMKMTSLADLQRTLDITQRRQQGTKTMRFLKRLQPFLDTMEQYSKVMNIFANTHEIVAFIWASQPCSTTEMVPADTARDP